MADVSTGKAPRGIKIALAVSVALNLAVVGLVAGLALNGGPMRGDRMGRDMGYGPFDAVFSPEDRAVLRRQIVGQMGDFRSMRQQMQGDMGAILSALRAEPFDPAQVQRAFDAQAQHMTEAVRLGNGLVRDYVVALTPEARDRFADRLEHVMQHGPDRGGKDDKGN